MKSSSTCQSVRYIPPPHTIFHTQSIPFRPINPSPFLTVHPHPSLFLRAPLLHPPFCHPMRRSVLSDSCKVCFAFHICELVCRPPENPFHRPFSRAQCQLSLDRPKPASCHAPASERPTWPIEKLANKINV